MEFYEKYVSKDNLEIKFVTFYCEPNNSNQRELYWCNYFEGLQQLMDKGIKVTFFPEEEYNSIMEMYRRSYAALVPTKPFSVELQAKTNEILDMIKNRCTSRVPIKQIVKAAEQRLQYVNV